MLDVTCHMLRSVGVQVRSFILIYTPTPNCPHQIQPRPKQARYTTGETIVTRTATLDGALPIRHAALVASHWYPYAARGSTLLS